MNDLTILHLSDLHIDSSGKSYSRLLKKLISDIKDEIRYTNDKSLILTVTGDILHKGPKYSDDTNAVDHALEFFKDLYDVLKNKVVGIYIVPGNHDKHRTADNHFLIPAYRSLHDELLEQKEKNNCNFDDSFYKHFWNFHHESYCENNGSGYIELTKKIYKIFGLSDKEIKNKTYIEDTFGVDIIEVRDKKFCFILLNTSWSCLDEQDNRNIILGEFQIKKIKNQFRNLMDEFNENSRPCITFVLGHHPIGALKGKEEDKIFNEMISFDSLDANVYLCGHTHNRTVNNWVNNRHSINTFVTGIGWPEDVGGAHVGDHTYSMYVFNIDANSVDVYVRSTTDDGSFSPDFKIYTSKRDINSKKLVFPIKAQESQTYIPLSVGDHRSEKAYYISEDFIKSIKSFVKKIEKFRTIVGMMIELAKSELYENILSKTKDAAEDERISGILYNYFFANIPDESETIIEASKKILQDNKNIVFDFFLCFLQKICIKMHQTLVSDLCEPNDIVRFHFRYLSDRNSFQYLRLCTSFQDEENSISHPLSEIKYGQLIEHSYKSERSLIYSINKDFTDNSLSENWKNFITVVPLFEKNNYNRKYAHNNIKIPYITFGVTTNNEKFDELLYFLDYFSIKETLEELIEQYMDIFHIDIDAFCLWAKKTLENGGTDNE